MHSRSPGSKTLPRSQPKVRNHSGKLCFVEVVFLTDEAMTAAGYDDAPVEDGPEELAEAWKQSPAIAAGQFISSFWSSTL